MNNVLQSLTVHEWLYKSPGVVVWYMHQSYTLSPKFRNVMSLSPSLLQLQHPFQPYLWEGLLALAARAERGLLVCGGDPAKVHRLAAGELVHGLERNVEGALSGVVDHLDEDTLALVAQLPAGAAVG